MTITYDLLASNVLGSNTASVTFSSISSSYRHLILVVNASSSANGNMMCRLNSDTTGPYPRIYMMGNGSSTSSSGQLDGNTFLLGQTVYLNSSSRAQIQTEFYDYGQSKHKSILVRANDSSLGTELGTLRWANTSAVTSILLYVDNSANFLAGSSFYLYGIVG